MANMSFKEEKYDVKQKRLKSFSNRFLYGFVIVFIAGYTLFFSSSLWLPKTYTGVTVTPVGETISQNDRNITVDRWVYSPGERTMEIILEIENNSIDGIEAYSYQGRTASGQIKTEAILNEGDIAVIHMTGIKKSWTEVSLTISASSDNSEEDISLFKPITIYMNDKVAEEVETIPILKGNDYKKLAYESKIEGFNSLIDSLNAEIEEIDNQIANIDERNKELEERLSGQTEKEKEETSSVITSLYYQKEALLREKENKVNEVGELKEKIDLQKKILEELN